MLFENLVFQCLKTKQNKKKKKKKKAFLDFSLFESVNGTCFSKTCFSNVKKKIKQEAHGPRVAHLSDIATADMQMLCNIFPVLSSQLMKRSTFKQFLILKKNIIYGMTVNGAWSFEQTLNHISTVGSMWNLEAIG